MTDWTATPDLVAGHVLLTELRAEHAAGLLAAADHDDVFRWTSRPRPRNLDEAAQTIAWFTANPDVHTWAQIDRASGLLAGVTSYYDIDPGRRTLAIGHTWLGRRHWRTPINTEAKLLLLTRAFDDLGCVRVVWHVDNLNVRSQAAVERLGAMHEGVLRKHRRRQDGSWRDTFTYSLLDDEWPAARDRLRARVSDG